jgi:hypothetical protein
MSLQLIQEKINNGEGFIETQESGVIRVSELNPNETIIWKPNKHDYKIVDDKLVLKTGDDKTAEANKTLQQKLLNQFKPLLDAMTFQEIAKGKGSSVENIIFTDDEIKNWGDYVGEIANGNLDAITPAIPEKYQNIL